MKKTLTLIALAGGFAAAMSAPLHAMSDEEMIGSGHAMLVGQLVNTLDRRGIPADGVDDLTLNEVVQLQQILANNSTNVSAMRSQATNLLEMAGQR